MRLQKWIIGGILVYLCLSKIALGQEFRRLPVEEYVDKMKAGWIGQMVGVGWGAPTEFKWKGTIIPADKVPKWKPGMVNQFQQDDLYVEMTFLRTLELYGLDVSIQQAGKDFAQTGYRLWHANRFGRENLRNGIAAPDSGHPQYNKHSDDIDYQIEADYSGLIAPGMPNVPIRLGEKFGRLMNFGDGVYGGQFVGGMYAEAFFEKDIVKIIEAGLRCIPKESQYAEMVRDMLKWKKENKDDWQRTWKLVEEKYHKDPRYTHGLCSPPGGKGVFGIDAKLNGAYILMGLLYGEGDIEQTVEIAIRCGQDSDCNPSNAGGILFTSIGYTALPARFTANLDLKKKFSHTPYDFPTLIQVCTKLARQAVKQSGGKTEKDDTGKEVLIIPNKTIKPSELLKTRDIRIRDPYIYADPKSKMYYMYAQAANRKNSGFTGVEVYTSKDLCHWHPPRTVLTLPDDAGIRAVWAPEMHTWNGRYYLFVTLTYDRTLTGKKPVELENWPAMHVRGTHIFQADTPLGPFIPIKSSSHTPKDWMALDGTLFVEKDTPYMIFCHEWVQLVDGTMDYVQLKADFSDTVGTPRLMFKASAAPGAEKSPDQGKVTDGCFLYRSPKSKRLFMIWSTFIPGNGYCVVLTHSKSGTIAGPWTEQKLIYTKNGGHGMIFESLDKRLMMALHQPNSGSKEQLHLFEVTDDGETLKIKEEVKLK